MQHDPSTKISVFTVMIPDLTPEEAAPILATAGYRGVEWRVTQVPAERRQETPSFWGNNLCTLEPVESDAKRAHEVAQAAGLSIPTLGTYIALGDLQAVEKSMRFAQIAGAPCIRVGVGKTGTAPYRQLFDETRTFLTSAANLARQYGVKALVETHHRTIAASASATFRLLEHLDPDDIGVIYDPGNMVHEGFEDYRVGLQLLGPYVAHVHIKNAAFQPVEGQGVWHAKWSPLENGAVNWQDLFAALAEIGYEGWFGLEDFSGARPTTEALNFNINFLKERIRESMRTGVA